MLELIWKKKLQEAVKRQKNFVWSEGEMKGAVFVPRYYPEINKRVSAALPIRWNQIKNLTY